MTALRDNLTGLAEALGDECKSIRTLVNANHADLSSLTTTNKVSLVGAINELRSALLNAGNATINDGSPSTATTWSSAKINQFIMAKVAVLDQEISAITNGAPVALNTLQELAGAIGNDPNFSNSISAALAVRVRVDISDQELTTDQKLNARQNIGALSQDDIGQDVNFVSIFNTGLL